MKIQKAGLLPPSVRAGTTLCGEPQTTEVQTLVEEKESDDLHVQVNTDLFGQH
ncbi:MAG: hypothetical protein V7L20_26085 [Nostoc sp.]|uniref:hypothetical protein n=1 Tax=Nostoc sp. TaxID=1180 RepID=UPI002FFC8AAF